jgi:hypothetical protein
VKQERLAGEKAEQERRAQQEAEAERRAAEKAEAERHALENTQPGPTPTKSQGSGARPETKPGQPGVGEPPPPKPYVDPKTIAASIKKGDGYMDHGQYAKAIQEFQNGLRLEPTNNVLRQKLNQARAAQAEEQQLGIPHE